jgi:hypothetical protein
MWNRTQCWEAGIFAAAKITHLGDDKTVAKMGHPIDANHKPKWLSSAWLMVEEISSGR